MIFDSKQPLTRGLPTVSPPTFPQGGPDRCGDPAFYREEMGDYYPTVEVYTCNPRYGTLIPV